MDELRGIVRIGNADIIGTKKIYSGLTQIYGVSHMFSNAICKCLGIGTNRQIGSLTEDEVRKIDSLIKNPGNIPSWLLNRRGDAETGKDIHLIASDLKLRAEFDVKMMKKIESYKGIRHAMGQPVRGQATKAHFRHGKTVGVTKKPKLGKKG